MDFLTPEEPQNDFLSDFDSVEEPQPDVAQHIGIESYTPEYAQPEYETDEAIIEGRRVTKEKFHQVYDTFAAAFHLENDVYNAMEWWDQLKYEGEEIDWEYNQFEDPLNEGYHDRNGFNELVSAAHAQRWREKIAKDDEQRKIIAESGTFEGVVANMSAGVLSPTSIIPFFAPGNIAKGAIVGGSSMFAISAAQEALLHQTQSERSITEDTVPNVLFSTIVGSALGGVVGGIKKADLDRYALDIEKTVNAPVDTSPGSVTSIGAANVGMSFEELELVNSFGLGTVSGKTKMAPSAWLAQSEFEEVRRLGQALSEDDYLREGNKAGVANEMSVETEVTLKNGEIYKIYESGDKYFKQLRKRGVKMTRKEFDEAVSDAFDAGDVHAIPEVQAQAKSIRDNIYDPRTRDAVEAGNLDKKYLEPKGVDGEGHSMRVWIRSKVAESAEGLKRIIADWIRKGEANMAEAHARKIDELKAAGKSTDDIEPYVPKDEDEITMVVEDTIRHILYGDESLPTSFKQGDFVDVKSTPLHARAFNIPNRLVRDYIEKDSMVVATRYNQQMSADNAIKKRFGTISMKDQWDRIYEEGRAKIAEAEKAGDTKRVKKLNKQLNDAKIFIAALRDRLRGTYGIPDNPNNVLYRTGRALRNLNYVRSLGSMTFAAIPDIGGIVIKNGMGNTLAGLQKILSAPEGIRSMAKQELRDAAIGLDWLLGGRGKAMADLTDPFTNTTKVEAALETASDWMGKLSLMDGWNTVMKQYAGILTQNNLIKAINKVNKGTATEKDITNLSRAYINENIAKQMASMIAKYGDDSTGLKLSGAADWDNPDLAELFRGAVLKTVNSTIVTPGIGDRPLFMSDAMGKFFMQFKTFAFTVVNRMTIPAMQQKDVSTLNGIIISVSLGYLSHYLKAAINGNLDEIEKENAQTMAYNAFDRSGLGGVLTEVAHLANKATGNAALTAAGITQGKASRMSARSAAGTFAGPSFGLAQDILSTVYSVTAPDAEFDNKAQIRALRLLPYNSLPYVRSLFMNLYEDK